MCGVDRQSSFHRGYGMILVEYIIFCLSYERGIYVWGIFGIQGDNKKWKFIIT